MDAGVCQTWVMKTCNSCGAENESSLVYCRMCAGAFCKEEISSPTNESAESELLRRADGVRVFTVHAPVGLNIEEVFGIVFGNSSKQAFWGLSTQADRLSRAYDAALLNLKYGAVLLGANAVVGVTFALNNSTGSSAVGIAGSSEAVMLIGTAVRIQE